MLNLLLSNRCEWNMQRAASKEGKKGLLTVGWYFKFWCDVFSVFGVVPLALQLCVPVYGKGA